MASASSLPTSNGSTPADGSPSTERSSARHEETVDRFVAFWGEMASSWGINRTMAQIHALLYCVETPLNTDDIMERLQISRGNANMNLRSLTEWNLVAKTRQKGSRKDYYVAEKDVWEITAQIIRERERREIQPVKSQLQECADHLVPDGSTIDQRPESDRVLYHRLEELIDLMDVFEGFSKALLPIVQQQNVALIKQLIAFAGSLDYSEREEGER